MLWFWIVIAAQFANAGALLLDKFLLTKKFPRPVVLTFWTAVANLFGLIFIFWNFNFFPGWYLLILSLLSGIAFTVALQFFYMAMKRGEATHIGPLVGGVVPIVSLIISYLWLSERLEQFQLLAVGLLVVGALIISFEKSKQHSGWHKGMLWALLAGIFFAASYVLARAVYLEESFSTGFVWGRIGCFIAILPVLFSKGIRSAIFVKAKKKQKQVKSGLVVLAVNKGLAALYFLGMSFAISLASATVVNALAGLQYAILFVLILAVTKFSPRFLKEHFTKREIVQQVIAIILIIGGLAVMVL